MDHSSGWRCQGYSEWVKEGDCVFTEIARPCQLPNMECADRLTRASKRAYQRAQTLAAHNPELFAEMARDIPRPDAAFARPPTVREWLASLLSRRR